MLGLQDVQDLRGPAGIGAVVEGQGDQVLLGAIALDVIGGRHDVVVLVGDQAGVRVQREGPLAGLGCRRDAQHLAVAVEVHVLRGRKVGQAGVRGLAVGVRKHRPDPGILHAHVPERVAAGPVVVGRLDLVEHGRRVEEPDGVVDAGIVRIGVGGIERALVEIDVRAGVAGVLGGLVEADPRGAVLLVGVQPLAMTVLVAGNPVVAVAAQRHDGLGLVQVRQLLVEVLLEPVLARDRPSARRGPVLVVGHQHHRVAGGLQLIQHGRILAEQGGDPDLPPQRIQRLIGLGDELDIGLHRRRREVLEIEDVAAIAARLGQVHEVGDEGGACGGIEQEGVGQRPVPIAVVGVVDHRQDRRLVRRLGEQGQGLRIVGNGQGAEGPPGGDPLGSEHVELTHMRRQGHPRALVPWRVEADGEGLERPRRAPRAAWHARQRRVELDLLRRLHVQGRKHPRVLQVHDREAGGESQGGEKGGDDRCDGGKQQPAQQRSTPRATPRGVVEDKVAHGERGRPNGGNIVRAPHDPSVRFHPRWFCRPLSRRTPATSAGRAGKSAPRRRSEPRNRAPTSCARAVAHRVAGRR